MSSPGFLLCVLTTFLFVAAQTLRPTTRPQPASQHATPGVTYRDVTNASGLSGFKHLSGTPAKNYIIEATGSGVTVFDFDTDGYVDIYLINGSSLERIQRGEPAPSAALY